MLKYRIAKGILHRSISDQSIVFVKLEIKPPKPTLQYFNTRTYRNDSAELFTRDLANEADLLSIFQESDILNDVLHSVLNSHAAIKSIKMRIRPCPFANQEIKDLVKPRDLLLIEQFLWTRQKSRDRQNFKEARKIVKKILLEAEI